MLAFQTFIHPFVFFFVQMLLAFSYSLTLFIFLSSFLHLFSYNTYFHPFFFVVSFSRLPSHFSFSVFLLPAFSQIPSLFSFPFFLSSYFFLFIYTIFIAFWMLSLFFLTYLFITFIPVMLSNILLPPSLEFRSLYRHDSTTLFIQLITIILSLCPPLLLLNSNYRPNTSYRRYDQQHYNNNNSSLSF